MYKYKAVALRFNDEDGYVRWSDDYINTGSLHKLDILKDWYLELQEEYRKVWKLAFGEDFDAHDKKHLWKRHNTYWVRVRVPNSVRHIIGKSEFSKNLYTKDLSEANRLKMEPVHKFKEEIYFAQKENERVSQSTSRKIS